MTMNSEAAWRQFFTGGRMRSVEIIKAERYRTYDWYWCFVREDGERLMLGANKFAHLLGSPSIGVEMKPPLESMRAAPAFFSPEEIAEKVLFDERERRHRRDEEAKRKRFEIARLQSELENEQ